MVKTGGVNGEDRRVNGGDRRVNGGDRRGEWWRQEG